MSVTADFAAFMSEHREWTGPIAGLLVFAESLALVGLLVPATATMIAVGGLIGTGVVDPLPVLACAIAGAVLGDWLSYAIGRRVGSGLLRRSVFRRHRTGLARTRLFFRRFGLLAVFLGRFLGPVRSTVPLVAGTMAMSRRKFQFANVASALLWVPVLLAPGYLATRNAGPLEQLPDSYMFGFVALVAILTLGTGLIAKRIMGAGRDSRARRSMRESAS